VYSHPSNDRVLALFPGRPTESAELGRFILLDSVPANGETWFLARTFELLRRESLLGVLSFSDPVPRRNLSGRVIFPGHVGTIYQAANACYLGRATARSLHLLPDGRVLSDRTLQKLRSKDRGWRYAAALLEQFGVDGSPPGCLDALGACATPAITSTPGFSRRDTGSTCRRHCLTPSS
jgi:hypothetical protein